MKVSTVLAGVVIAVEYKNSDRCKVVLKDYKKRTLMTGFVGTPTQCANFVTRKTGEIFILA